jgi:hypothetical protein
MEITLMFNVGFLAAQSRRLGLGIAVAALTLTSLAAPISAFAAQTGDASGPMAPVKPTIHAPVTIDVRADLEVTARGKEVKNGTTYYHFLIKNLGPAPASQIIGYKEAHTYALVGNGFQLVDNGYFNLSLASGESKAITVTCTPPAGMYCERGNALAYMNNNADPNFDNNVATIK